MDQFSAYEKCLQLGWCHPGNGGQMATRGRCVPAPGPGGVKTDCSYHHMCTVWWGRGGLLAGLLCVAPSSIAPSDTPLGPILLCPLPSHRLRQWWSSLPSFPSPSPSLIRFILKKFIFNNYCQSGFDLPFSLSHPSKRFIGK